MEPLANDRPEESHNAIPKTRTVVEPSGRGGMGEEPVRPGRSRQRCEPVVAYGKFLRQSVQDRQLRWIVTSEHIADCLSGGVGSIPDRSGKGLGEAAIRDSRINRGGPATRSKARCRRQIRIFRNQSAQLEQ